MSDSISVYELVVPVYRTVLKNMAHFLTKGEAFAKSKGIPEEEV